MLMASTLRKIGFEVTVQNDLMLVPLRRAISDYARRLREAGPNTVGFFFYSGHGAADADVGPNYLIPVDANLDDDELGTVSERLEGIIDTLANVSNSVIQFVVFDACRNVLKRRATRGAARGFVAVEQRRGMVIVFSAAPKELALDEHPRGSTNGPFAKKFSENLQKSGKREDALLTDVQNAVYDFTGGLQSPYVVRSRREFSFSGSASNASDKPIQPPAASARTTRSALTQLQEVIESGSLVDAERDQLTATLQR